MGYISSCHALPLVRSLQFAVDVYEAFLVPAIPEPCCFPGLRSPETRLPIASLRYPPQPLRKAPFLPTESSASAYGKLRVCLRKLRPSAYGKLRLVSRCVLLLVINSLFPQLNPPVFTVTVQVKCTRKSFNLKDGILISFQCKFMLEMGYFEYKYPSLTASQHCTGITGQSHLMLHLSKITHAS